MARPRKIPRPDDWVAGETIELTDGTRAVQWHNVVTGESATLREGLHPFQNPNAIVAAPAPALVEKEDEPEDEPEDEESAADKISILMRGFRGDEGRAEVKIWRIKPDGSESYCGSPTAENFLAESYDLIRRSWGAGKYRLILYATNPQTKKFARRGMQIIEIEDEKPSASLPVIGSETSSIAPLLEKLIQRIEKLEEKPKESPEENFAKMLMLMKTMREAIGVPVQPPSTSSTIKELAETFGLLRQIRAEIEPPPEPSDPLAATLPKLLEIVQHATMNKQETVLPTVSVPVQLQQPVQQPIPQSNPAPSPQQPQDEEMMKVQLAISILNSRAKANQDVEESAEQVLDYAPDELLALLERPDWWDTLSAAFPALTPHRDWYTRLRDRVLAMLQEENTDANENL
jgi:hypothetical protein